MSQTGLELVILPPEALGLQVSATVPGPTLGFLWVCLNIFHSSLFFSLHWLVSRAFLGMSSPESSYCRWLSGEL